MTGRARAAGEGSIFPYRSGFAAYSWVRTPTGKRTKKWVYGRTRQQVHDKWIALQSLAKDTAIPNRVPTLSEHLQYWLAEIVRPNLAPLTYQTYEIIVRLYIEPHLGAKRLDRLQLREVQSWINTIARACQCCAQDKDAGRPPSKQRCCAVDRCCQTTVSPRTLSDIRGCLRSALGQAVTEELVSRNVAAAVKLPKVRSRSNRRQAWTTDEARRFLESARADHDPFYAAYVLILVLGLRKGEVLGLTWAHVDLDKSSLHIALQLQRVSRELLHRETKTEGSDGVLPLPGICATALRLRHDDQIRARAAAGSAWQGNDLVFTTRYGTPIEPRNFNRSWDARCAKADIRKITVHDGRRSCGTLLADLDVHPRVAMQILRHAQFALTMEIYTLASPDATKEALKRLGASLDR
ncbi:tyrosine-type recombinase/integrase [Pseudonocardia kunmingensis]|uniref:Site-specific recombinase XerD n=1 Tax=Pseudonocardia kunmingensis TaxID=630975 RepID=A0A543DNT9_9PSEU|nr:site-specific integrase [Pseudonocardia kunmingensis]TQM11000.1 site-specific recombinase XerD [Pseudonocardia kunmingensis]